MPTDDVNVGLDGPNVDAVPPGIAPNFIVQRAGTEFPGINVVLGPPNIFTVTIASGAGTLQRIRYNGAAPTWFNAGGGQLLAFDVTLPFP